MMKTGCKNLDHAVVERPLEQSIKAAFVIVRHEVA
jgi:hypothetical protein